MAWQYYRVFFRTSTYIDSGPITVTNAFSCQNSTYRPSASLEYNLDSDPGLRVSQQLNTTTPWGLTYRIAGLRFSPGYSRCRIQVKTFDPFCREQYLEGAPRAGIVPSAPENVYFWFCAVSEAPKVTSGQTILSQPGVSFKSNVLLDSPLTKIPESFTVTGLPAGVSLNFNQFPESLSPLEPEEVYPVLEGTVQTPGVYTVNITATNLVGSTTTPVTINIAGKITASRLEEGRFFSVPGTPSSAAIFDISGEGLTQNISASFTTDLCYLYQDPFFCEGTSFDASQYYEVSLDGVNYASSANIPVNSGMAASRIFVRLKTTASPGTIYGGLKLNSEFAEEVLIRFFAQVLTPLTPLDTSTEVSGRLGTNHAVRESKNIQLSTGFPPPINQCDCAHHVPFEFTLRGPNGQTLYDLQFDGPVDFWPTWVAVDAAQSRVYTPSGRGALDTVPIGGTLTRPSIQLRAKVGGSSTFSYFRIVFSVGKGLAGVVMLSNFRAYTGNAVTWPHKIFVFSKGEWAFFDNNFAYPITFEYLDFDRVSWSTSPGTLTRFGSMTLSWTDLNNEGSARKDPIGLGRYLKTVRGSAAFGLMGDGGYLTYSPATFGSGDYLIIINAPRIEKNQVFEVQQNRPVSLKVQLSNPQDVNNDWQFWYYDQLPDGLWMKLSTGEIFGFTTQSGQFVSKISVRGQDLYTEDSATVTFVVTDGPPITTAVSTFQLAGFRATVGRPSEPKSFTVSGENLIGPISVLAGRFFEVAFGDLNYSESVSISPTGGVIAGTTVRVRLTNEAQLGALSGELMVSSSGTADKTIRLTGEVLTVKTRPVTFFVNMSVMAGLGRFFPEFDRVEVRGEFNNWAGTEMYDADGDGIYSTTLIVEGEPDSIQKFKFIVWTNSLSWESIPDREFTLGSAETAQILDVLYFNNIPTLPPVLVGASQIISLYVGGNAVTRMHLGEVQVFP